MNNFAKTVILASIVILASVVIVSADADAMDPNATEIDDQADLTSAFSNGGSYYLTTDIECGSVTASETDRNPIFTVASGVTVTLDLRGHKITASIDSNSDSYANCQIILNQGVLNIIDTVGGGSIENTNTNSNISTRTVKNDTGAELNVSDVTISSASAVAIINLGTCTIGDGSNITALREGFIGGWSNGCVAIDNRGTDTEGGVLKVNGGTISSASQSGIYTDYDNSTTFITAGIVSGSSSYGAIGGSSADTTVHISGGSFSSDVSMMVDDGYYITEVEGRYVVNQAEPSNPTVTTEEDLIGAIPDDDSIDATITLGADITLNQSVTVPRNTTIVVSPGITLTVSDASVVNLLGTIDNSGDLIIEGYVSNLFSITGEGTISVTSQPSEDGTYEISTAMELQWLAYLMNENPGRVWNVQLVDNIRIPDGVTFIMLGTTADDRGYISFNGTFDGNGHGISGIVMSSTGTPLGLFHSLQNAEVSDLTLDVDMTTNTGYIGGLAAYSAGGVTVDNVTINGNVTVAGTSYGSGGLFGSIHPSGDTEIISCTVNANVGGASACNVGGIYGTCENTDGNIGIYNCEVYGDLSSTDRSRGFVFGWGHMTSGKITIIGFTNGSDDKTLSYCPSVGTDADFTVDDEHIGSEYEAVVGPDGNWTYRDGDEPTVAMIGSVEFTSLVGAVTYATEGDTIVLQDNITLGHIVIDKGVNLDLNGYIITLQADGSNVLGIEFTAGSSTISGGTISDPRGQTGTGFYAISVSGTGTSLGISGTSIQFYDGNDDYNYGMQVSDHASVTLGNEAVIQSTTTSGRALSVGVIIAGDGTAENTRITMLDGSRIDVNMIGIGGNGSQNPSQGATTIDIQGGTIDAGIGTGIFQSQVGEVLVSGNAVITGATGIEIRSGTFTMTGGTVTGNAQFAEWESGNGNTVDGVGIALSQHTYDPEININISGGTLSGFYAFYQANHRPNDAQDNPSLIHVSINGGTFIATDNGTTDASKTPAPLRSEALTGFVSGGSFSAEIPEDYIASNASLYEENGRYNVYRSYTVTFMLENETFSQTTVREGQTVSVVDVPDAPAGCEYVWYYDGAEWDPSVPVTSDMTIEARMFITDLSVDVEITTEGGVTTFTAVVITESTDNIAYSWRLVGGDVLSTDRTLTNPEPGNYVLEVTATRSADVTATETVEFSYRPTAIPDEPTPDPGWNPGWDDDDDYVPPIYVPSGSSSSDDDTVKIVACAAAAVVAAIMAAFLILGHRRE